MSDKKNVSGAVGGGGGVGAAGAERDARAARRGADGADRPTSDDTGYGDDKDEVGLISLVGREGFLLA